MPEYAILLNPGHSRVYFDSLLKLSTCEMKAAAAKMKALCTDIKTRGIGGIAYMTFASEESLGEGDIRILSRLSFAYAIFELKNGGECLIPLEKRAEEFIDAGISSMLKYAGKTNELFTRLLINLAIFASNTGNDNLRMLDPVAGKGTALLEGLVLGLDVAGIEIMDKPTRELEAFLKKYLENARYKHSYKNERISGNNPVFRAAVNSFEMAKSKDGFKSPHGKRTLVMVTGDSQFADRYFKKNSFDMIAGDLPYGVAHGNVSGGSRRGSPARSPKELLSACLPAWRTVLKSGGSLALSWNSFVMSKNELAGLLIQNGFTVLGGEAHGNLEHRVDQAIKRDVIIAAKK